MKKGIMLLLVLCGCVQISFADNITILKNMFADMVVKKHINTMSKYYTPDFKLYSNGKTMDYAQFYQGHRKEYLTPIQYAIQFDKQATVENGNMAAARVFITTSMPHQKPTKIQVILIAKFTDNKINTLWELTFPNWVKMKNFKTFKSHISNE